MSKVRKHGGFFAGCAPIVRNVSGHSF